MGFIIEGGELVFKAEAVHPIDFSNMLTSIMTSARSQMGNKNKELFEQYFTDLSTATFMAGLFKEKFKKRVKILDAGAGIGILGAATVIEICSWSKPPQEIFLVAYEIDEKLLPALQETFSICNEICSEYGIKFIGEIIQENFISTSAISLPTIKSKDQFDYAILNPPYKKINNDTEENRLLLSIGIDASNQYAAFVSLIKRWLLKNGEFVAITPRSFCNGQYFINFRKDLLNDTVIKHFHLFESRSKVFTGEDILQESVIYHAIKKRPGSNSSVTLTFSNTQSFDEIETNEITYDQLILPNDPLRIFRIIKNTSDAEIRDKVVSLPCTLVDLGMSFSTGPVVDFREVEGTLSKDVSVNTVPLIYPEHFSQGQGFVQWPKEIVKKYNSIRLTPENITRLRPKGTYVLVKRMTSKEERRRVVAAVYEGDKLEFELVGFDNKVNFYHINGLGFDKTLAKGLSLFLNSTLVDRYFRQFSGNTQVNATDLRNIRYPSYEDLIKLGNSYTTELPPQEIIDQVVEGICFYES